MTAPTTDSTRTGAKVTTTTTESPLQLAPVGKPPNVHALGSDEELFVDVEWNASSFSRWGSAGDVTGTREHQAERARTNLSQQRTISTAQSNRHLSQPP